MRRWIAAVMAGLAVIGLAGQPLFPLASAEPLPPEEVEALNKWVNWDPNSGCEDTAGPDDVATGNLIPDDQIPGKDNRQKIWNYLVALGFKPVEAAGILGNIGREGVYDPTNIEDPAGTTKDWDVLLSLTATNQGYGLIGFTPGRSLAKGDTSNVDWSGIAKVDVNKDNFYYISTQLAVVRGYMKNSPSPAGKKNMLEEFEARSTSAAQAAVAFMDLVENPGVLATAEREQFANDAMRDFGGIAPGSIPLGTVAAGGGAASCCPSGGAGAGTPTDKKGNEAAIWNFLVGDMKLSDKQAAGIMGNIEQESGFSPTALNPSSGAYGIVQWYAGRNTALTEFAASKGKPKSDMQVQLEFLRTELEGAYKESVLKPIQNSDDLTEITRIWLESFEIPCTPGSSACDAEMDIRLPNAKRALQEYGGTGPDGSSVSSSGCGSSGRQPGANGWELTGPNAMVVYDQCDSKWGSKPYGEGKSAICESGCGIASLAMVISTLTDKQETPASLAKQYGDKYHGSSGTDWSLWPVAARDYGLNLDDLGTDLDKAAKIVKSGGLVIISVDPGEFTGGGHLMVIRAVTDDGKFLLADPNNKGSPASGNTNTTPYSADFLRTKGALKYLWGFTKNQSSGVKAVPA